MPTHSRMFWVLGIAWLAQVADRLEKGHQQLNMNGPGRHPGSLTQSEAKGSLGEVGVAAQAGDEQE